MIRGGPADRGTAAHRVRYLESSRPHAPDGISPEGVGLPFPKRNRMTGETMKERYDLFTEETNYVDYSHPAIQTLARELFTDTMSETQKAKAAYDFVRDRIHHSFDIGARVVNVTASECLMNQTGVCHAKANLLAALLRSQGIPTGFCFQHLARDDTGSHQAPGFVTHGYNAVYLNGAWIRLDARGNNDTVHTEFSTEEPVLAFQAKKEQGGI